MHKEKDLKIKFRDKVLDFQYLGEFEIERDKKGFPIIYQNNHLLSVKTELTESTKVESITILPDRLRLELKRKYYDSKNLKDVWRSPGIYIFVSVENNHIKYRYIGRASNTVIQRLRGYLSPGLGQSTNNFVNYSISDLLKKGDIVLVYFHPERDTEKDLQILLHPDWNREVLKHS